MHTVVVVTEGERVRGAEALARAQPGEGRALRGEADETGR